MEDKDLLQVNQIKSVRGGSDGEIIITNKPTPSSSFEFSRNCPACGSSHCTRVKTDTYCYEYTCNDCGNVCRRSL